MAAGITCSNCGHSRSQHFFMIWQHELPGDTRTNYCKVCEYKEFRE
jgi:predicted nucleic-acid-binding Zn-ribbon protein